MKQVSLLILSIFLCATAYSADVPKMTAERHMSTGIQCTSCHKNGDTTLPVRKEQCLTCHGSYEAMAKRTENVKPNPPLQPLW